MKNIGLLWVLLLFIPLSINGQLTNIDKISPFHEGIASVKSGAQWAFINTDGEIVIDFRDDLVIGKKCEMECCANNAPSMYPIFKNGRALIVELKDGISHYGYIDEKGETIIKPTFINANHFNDNKAIVLKMYKEVLGKNEILGKNVVSYSYNEVIIDRQGNTITHLSGPYNLIYSKDKLRTPPTIVSKVLASNLIAIRAEDGTWEIRPINE